MTTDAARLLEPDLCALRAQIRRTALRLRHVSRGLERPAPLRRRLRLLRGGRARATP